VTNSAIFYAFFRVFFRVVNHCLLVVYAIQCIFFIIFVFFFLRK